MLWHPSWGCRGQLSGRDGLLICGTRGRHRNAFSRRRKRENAIQRARLWSIDSQRCTGYPAFRSDSTTNASRMCQWSHAIIGLLGPVIFFLFKTSISYYIVKITNSTEKKKDYSRKNVKKRPDFDNFLSFPSLCNLFNVLYLIIF